MRRFLAFFCRRALVELFTRNPSMSRVADLFDNSQYAILTRKFGHLFSFLHSGVTWLGASGSYNHASERESDFDWVTLLAFGLVGTWFFVAIGLLIRGGVQYLRFAIRLRKCPELVDQPIVDQVLRECDALRCRRRPKLKEVDGLTVPAVFGLWKHTICLPPGSTQQLSPEEFRWVLRHEIAHITRHDSLLLSVALFLRAIHWINPLVWLSVSRLRNHMEQAADDTAMQSESEHSLVEYGRLLLKYAAGHTTTHQSATMGLLFVSGSKRLKQRIEMLDQNQRRNHWSAKCLATVILLLVVLTGLTDAKSPEPISKLHLPTMSNLSVGVLPTPGDAETDEPEFEVTYDAEGVLAKLTETLHDSQIDSKLYLTSHFRQFSSPTATLSDGKLTITQTADAHRLTESLLHAWELSGAWQITIEYCIITADLNVVSDFDWVLPSDFPAPNQYPDLAVAEFPKVGIALDPLSPSSDAFGNFLSIEATDRNISMCPVVATKISSFQTRLLHRRLQRDAQSNICFAPKVTLFNGQRTWLSDEVHHPYVTGMRASPDKAEKWQPVIRVAREGSRMLLHPEVTEDGNIDLRCLIVESELQSIDLAHLPLPVSGDPTANVTVRVPNISQKILRSNVRLATGESLLIVSPATFKSDASDQNPTATFYVITPRLISEKEAFGAPADASPSVPTSVKPKPVVSGNEAN